MKPSKRIRFLIAEDDPEDQLLLRNAFKEARAATSLDVVSNGEELLKFLRKRGEYAHTHRPDVILMDLNMPKMDGREALKAIKADPALKAIPVLVLTTSSAEEDIARSYELGVSSYLRKPGTFAALVDLTKELGRYWSEVAELPANHARTASKA